MSTKPGQLQVSIELSIGGKSCDLVIAYDTSLHEPFAKAVGIAPAEGVLIAFEVEVSDPQRTAARNLSRNTEAGIAHTIIATMTPLRRTPAGAIVVDVFALLEAL